MDVDVDLSQAIEKPVFDPVIDTFRSVAAERPAAVAVCQGDLRWTYGELAAQVDALSERLSSVSDPGDVVVLHGSPSLAMVTGLFACFQSERVALPMDLVLPVRRRRELARRAGTRVVLDCDLPPADQPLGVPPAPNLTVRSGTPGGRQAGPRAHLSGERSDAAYVFFTSGTTGEPTGVVGSHQSLAHFLCWEREALGVTAGDVVAQITGWSFDAVLRDVCLPLTGGGRLCLPGPAERSRPDRLLRWLQSSGVTIVHTVPSVLGSWLRVASSAHCDLAAVRYLLLAGEPLHSSLVEAWHERFPRSPARLVNLYGTTETTMIKAYTVLGRVPPRGVQRIGRPLPNSQILVVDADGVPSRAGEIGQVVIRTRFPALRLLDRGGRASTVLRNPYRPDDPTDVMSLTGDLGRWCEDGSIELLGRVDDQLKIRGVRLNPLEVQDRLLEHPGVSQCAVQPSPPSDSAPSLVAYVVRSARGARVGHSELRQHCGEALSGPMIPGRFVFLNTLPTGPNGKVDRERLSQLGPGPDAAPFVAARTAAEVEVANIWTSLLEIERVGVTDDFFQVGGHSLLALVMLTRVHTDLGVHVKLRSFLRCPTIEAIAAAVDQAAGAGGREGA